MKMDPYVWKKLSYDGKFKTELLFWEEQLSGDIPATLFKDKTPLQSESGGNKCFNFVLPNELSRLVQQLCKGSDIGIFTVLLSALLYVQHRFSGVLRAIAASPVLNTLHDEANNIVVFNHEPQSGQCFRSYLASVKETMMQAYRHQNFPLKTAIGESPLHTLIRLNSLHPQFDPASIAFDLFFDFSIKKERLRCSVVYQSRLFNEGYVERVAAAIEQFLSRSLADPDAALSGIELVSHEDCDLLKAFNETEAEYPRGATLYGLFEEQASRTPERTAVVCGERELSYRELDEQSNQAARLLRKLGVTSDDVVGICMERSPELMVGLLGIGKAGGAYLPIDPSLPEERIRYMLEDSGARIVLTAGESEGKYGPDRAVLDLKAGECREESAERLERKSCSTNLAYVIYTSGSTGHPKGVMVEHESAVNRLHWMQQAYPLTEGDVVLQKTPISFDVSVWELFWWGMYGAKVSLLEPGAEKDPAQVAETIERDGVTTLHFVPSMLGAFLGHIEETGKRGKLSSVRQVFASGEALDAAKANRFNRLMEESGARLINLYGPTEATVDVTCYEVPSGEEIERVPIGKPIANTRMYVVDGSMRLQPIGVAGELCIAGTGLARGYLNRPELTEEKFVQHPNGERLYRTGDWARWLPDGNLEYLGRIDQQVKIRGYRIELGEIEAVLQQHEQVKEAAVLAKEDRNGELFLCAYVVRRQGKDADIREMLSCHLPAYMIPSHIIVMDALPITANGKLDRKGLPDPEAGLYVSAAYAVPSNERELQLALIWEQALGLDNIGVNDSYFSLGGDSIKGIRLIDTINKTFGIRLQMADLYKKPTIRGLVSHMEENGGLSVVNPAYEEVETELELLKTKLWDTRGLLADASLDDIYPMSDIQKGMVHYSLLYLDAALYHDQFVYQWEEDSFDLDLLHLALECMTNKHEMLRASLHLEEGGIQAIHRTIPLPLEFADIGKESREEQERFIQEELERDRLCGFDLTAAPLFRMKVYRLSERRFALCWIFHHAIMDGWSVASFMTELLRVYVELRKDRSFKPEPLASRYKSFVVEQLVLKRNEEIKSYWKRELDGYKRLELSHDYGAQQQGKSTIRRAIEWNRWNEWKEGASRRNSPIKNIVAAAYFMMLQMVSYENDVVAGIVEHNRPVVEDGDRIIGCFLNTVPVRMQVEKGMTWEDWIKGVERKMEEVKVYGKLSLLEIVEAIGESPSERNPIFDTFFNYIDFHVLEDMNRFVDAGIAGSNEELAVNGYENTNTLLDFTLSATFEQPVISVHFHAGALSREQVERMIDYYLAVIERILHEPEQRIDKAQLINEEERGLLLRQFNDTGFAFPEGQTIHEMFEEQVGQRPMQTAVSVGEYRLTYRELDEQAELICEWLQSSGISRNQIVAIAMERSIEMVVAILAVLKAGAAYMPIDPDHPEDRIRYMLEDSKASAMLVTALHKERLTNLFAEGIQTLEVKLDRNVRTSGVTSRRTKGTSLDSDLAYVIYTSGSTGEPKGVMVQHRNAVNLLRALQEAYPLEERDTYLLKTSFTFDVSVAELFGWFVGGGKLAILPPGEEKMPSQIIRAIKDFQITHINFVPSMLKAMLDELDNSEEGTGRLKYIFSAGEALKATVIQQFVRLQEQGKMTAQLDNLYGPTEATVYASRYAVKAEDGNRLHIPIGFPIANVRLYVVDASFMLQPIGVPGELCIAGAGLASGYLNRPELTTDKFMNNPYASGEKMYRTGDLARWLPDGTIEYLGRIDHQVKIRGYRIELGEIESRLQAHQKVKEAVVVAGEDACGELELRAYMIIDGESDPGELRQFIGELLPSYMIPSHFITLEHFPLTPNGKLDRKALPLPEETAVDQGTLVSPRTLLELRLAEIWQNVLGVRHIGVKDNFFERGGHSLKAVSLMTLLHKELNVRLPLGILFQEPTIEQLAHVIEQTEGVPFNAIEPSGERDYYPVSTAQKRLYILQQHAGDVAYNMPFKLKIEGELDIGRFRNAIEKLVERHELLRTSFEEIEGVTVQRVHPCLNDAAFDYIPLQDEELDKAASRFIAPFDLGKPPLFRSALFKIGEGVHVFMIDMHHIISDGSSLGIFIHELVQLYECQELPPLALQYKDYAVWQQSPIGMQRIEGQQNYWLNKFKDGVPMLELPLDYRRPALRSLDGASVQAIVESGLADKLRIMARDQNGTLYMVLLTTYFILLSKYSGQEDIVVGSGIAGRSHADLQGMIGMFVNTLVLRSQPGQDKSFLQFLGEVRDQLLEAYEHQDYPFETLVEELAHDVPANRNPLFDASIVLQNMDRGNSELTFGGASVQLLPVGSKTSKFDMTMFVAELDEEIGIEIEYSTQLFKAETMERLLADFIRLLTMAAENTLMPIKDMNLHKNVAFKGENVFSDLEDILW
ncbi:amino acid adenylation domain-containing protein [Paenibacillus oenotherae]|uniref:Amino acid adenylation domain-containing protein n=1 Tax=Paenibacillus oenotherae TaxID=1435645 RepID=A0ABS7DDV4_9BACL|nr:non-ribosomal peptide synthetase [Paenibacillus oenotherae]MBW7477831.1 amino acid adenylation domain-containing protein [Paenibacillus oenotherae]